MQEEEKKKNKKENKTKIEELNLKIKSLEEEVLRSKADLINYRKRKDEETSNLLKYGNSDILLQIVNVLDDFDRALNVKEENLTPEVNNFLIGFKLIDKSLKDILTSNNVKEIECLGEKFDPNMEQSLCSKCDNTKEDEEVLEVLTKGYTYYDRVLRYASVMINKKDVNNLNEVLPTEVINKLKEKKINFYIINANKIAYENNIPNKISMIMEITILSLMNMDMSFVKKEMKKLIKFNFSKKGIDVVNSNINAINSSLSSLKKVDISLIDSKIKMEKVDNTLYSKLEHARYDLIKVSDFNSNVDGVFECGTSVLEKRDLSNNIPSYDKDKCIMCNMCSLVCPHAVVRPYLLNEDEVNKSPSIVKESLKDAKIKDNNLNFTIGISALDCTGCSLCSMVCPTKAITLKKQNLEARQKEIERYNYLQTVSEKHVLPINTVKGSQFVKPKFEFSGACAGCGETPYLKLLSQLFGDDLMIANATGCSSIYGASVPSMPYTVPWINSLFEDNAEFGYGIRVGEDFMHEKVKRILQTNWTKVKRYYYAVVNGIVKENNHLENYLLETKTHDVIITKDKEKGILAITNFEVMEYNKKYTLLNIEIKTGRKNQIRVQLANIKHPIVGDKKYGNKERMPLCLQAYRLEFLHPITNKNIEIEIKLPKNLENLIK